MCSESASSWNTDSTAVSGTMESILLIFSVWPGAVVSGARLLKSIAPSSVATKPIGLVKSILSATRRPWLVAPRSLQAKTPVKRARPWASRAKAANGDRSPGCGPPLAKARREASMSA